MQRTKRKPKCTNNNNKNLMKNFTFNFYLKCNNNKKEQWLSHYVFFVLCVCVCVKKKGGVGGIIVAWANK